MEHTPDPSILNAVKRVYFGVAMECSAPIFWHRRTEPSTAVVNSGTIYFVNAGQGTFAITAKHVLEGYEQALEGQELTCMIAELPIDPLEREIARHPVADIATLRFSSEKVAQIGKKVHAPTGMWPPGPPEEDKGVFFGGYRALDRQVSPGNIEWGFGAYLGIARNVRDGRFSIQFEREFWIPDSELPPPGQGETWGGASGGPVFAVVSGAVDSWRVTGVIVEHQADMEVFYVHTLTDVLRDGTIRPS